MGRYYNGDIDGKFMFAVQSSDAGERFGAIEQESGYIDYVVYKEDSYKAIAEELKEIEETGVVDRVNKMFKDDWLWNDEKMKKFGVSSQDMSEYADHRMGKQMKDYFDNNPDESELYFTAEI
tara:strand:+ start:97 stop:462 length:366 start_codon:yes stop_codon:yes gene_type:complete